MIKQKLSAIIRLLRPHHWLKNSFIFTGLIFSHMWTSATIFYYVVLAAIAFSLLASSIYIFNDIIDYENDRLHPFKKFRPIAADIISPQLSLFIATILLVFCLSLGFYISISLGIIFISYIILNILYSLYLKHMVILDVFAIAGGFTLRVLAGTIGIMIPLSHWLVLCTLMLALFLGFTKRYAELLLTQQSVIPTRNVLQHYTPALLDKFILISAGGAIFSYCIYTLSPTTIQTHHTANLVYTIPLVLYGFYRYLYLLYQNKPNTFHDIAVDLVKDKFLRYTILSWFVLTILIIA